MSEHDERIQTVSGLRVVQPDDHAEIRADVERLRPLEPIWAKDRDVLIHHIVTLLGENAEQQKALNGAARVIKMQETVSDERRTDNARLRKALEEIKRDAMARIPGAVYLRFTAIVDATLSPQETPNAD